MTQPTPEQIENAARAIAREVYSATGTQNDRCVRAANAAFPHLQLPWEPFTEEEWTTCTHNSQGSLNHANDMLRRRNSPLLLETIDPRIEKIAPVIEAHDGRETSGYLARLILAALDAAKEK